MTEWFVIKEFKELGSRIYTMTILLIIGFIVGLFISFVNSILNIIAFIYLFMALGNIKRIDIQLKDKNFGEFRSKFKQSIMLGIIGYMTLSITFSVMLIMLSMTGDILVILYALPAIIIGGVIILIAIAIEKKAWHELHSFLEQHQGMFSDYLTRELLEGTDKLEQACKYLLLFFLIITVIIAVIYIVIGLFKLAKMKDINPQQSQSITPSYAPAPVSGPVSTPSPALPAAATGGRANFCPGCGHKLEGNPKFCTLCGEKIE